MTLSGERYAITASGYTAEVSEVGAALAGLWLDGKPVIVDTGADELPPKSAGCVLAPWPNRIRDGRYRFDGVDYQLPLTEPALHNASHGLARWSRWQLLEQTESSVLLSCDLVPQTGYPFEIRLHLLYILDAEGLTVRLAATNTGQRPAPFGVGFHPYFDLGTSALDDAQLQVPAESVRRTDEQRIPVETLPVAGTGYDLRRLRPLGELRLDHNFTGLTGSTAVLTTAARTVELHWDRSFHNLQVFTPPFVTPGRNAIALEPMSCPADAFNSGEDLVRLEPDQRWTGEWSIRVTA
ncbi:MAG TPA: aldose 1-epimerase family protein [Jatrophihabitans sp.]|nr:aldose 1-epimerase family protein [Jatrophihabitans sp.]